MCVSLVYQSWQKIGFFRHSGAFDHKPFTLFQVIAVDADPRNLAYLRTSLDLNNSTNNVRILYNAVRLEWNTTGLCTDETDPHRHRYLKWIIVTLIHQQRGGHPLPNDPRPEQRGCCPYVHRGAPPCREPQSNPVIFLRFNSVAAKNVLSQLSHQLIPSPWQKFWSVSFLYLPWPRFGYIALYWS